MNFSVGHHSTSDDSFAYRPRQEVEDRKRVDNPIARFRLFLESRGWWSAEEEESYKTAVKKEIMTAFKRAENLPRNELKEMFSDVYGGEEPWTIVSTMCCCFSGSMLISFRRRNREKNSKLFSRSTAALGNHGKPNSRSTREKARSSLMHNLHHPLY